MGDHGVSTKEDRLGGTIAKENNQPAENTQASICQQCGHGFRPRNRSGGSPQQFCSTACRKASHANVRSVASIVSDAGENTGENVAKDAGNPDAGTLAPVLPPDDDAFSWRDEITVIRSQPAICVYFNPHNDIVIRQEGWPDEDRWIYINRQNLHLLIRRLQEIENERA